MRFEDRQEPEAREPVATPPEASLPPDPHALLALQRGAGNAAVGRMLSRFYSREADGKLHWQDNKTYDATQWEHTGWTSWMLIPYRVYERTKLPALVRDEVLEAPKKAGKGRRGPRGKKSTTGAAAPVTEPIERDVTEEEAEEPTDVAQELPEGAEQEETPPQVLDDDGGGWEEVRSAGAVRAEREMARDVDGLARIIDAHGGEPGAISETFSQFFNASVRQNLEVEGTIVGAYTTRDERAAADGRYSIEVTIPGLTAWVIHAHLTAEGELARGPNPIHYKRLSELGSLGVSIALTPRQVGAMLPDQATRAASAAAAGRAGRNV